MTLPLGQGISCDKDGGDGRTDRRVGHTGCHRFWGAEDHPCAHLHHASTRAPFHDLSIPQTGRSPPLRCGRGTPAPLMRRVVPCSGGVQHDVPVGGPWIAGAQRHGVIRDMRDPSQHHMRTGLIPLAEDAGLAAPVAASAPHRCFWRVVSHVLSRVCGHRACRP